MPALSDALHRNDPVFGGAGAAIAVGLLFALLILLPADERRLVRGPSLCLLGYFAWLVCEAWLPVQTPGQGFLRSVALFLLLMSIGRSAFLVFANGVWVRRWARPWPKILRDVVQALVYIAVGLLVLRAAGVEPGSLLTTSALLTAVLGLSLQDTLGNLFAGLAIQAQRPFEVGDWIRFDSKEGAVGRVVEINWRATRVLTLSQVEVTVPNAAAAKSHIFNYSKPRALVRQQVQVYTPFDVSPERARRLMLHALRHTPSVLTSPEPFVVCRDFHERGMLYEVRYFIDQFDRHEITESEVRERLWYALQRENYAMPVPARRVQLTQAPNETEHGKDAAVDFRHRLLARLDLFAGLSEAELQSLAEQCRHQSYAREELIVHTGEEGTDMFVIERGAVRIESPGPRPRVIGELSRGEFFGEMSLLTGEPRAADVVATEETEVLVLDRAGIAPLIEQNPVLAEKITRVLVERQERLLEAQGSGGRDTQPGAEREELLGKIRRFFGLR